MLVLFSFPRTKDAWQFIKNWHELFTASKYMDGKRNNRRQRVTKTTLTGNQKNTLQLEPLVVAIQLHFTDPESVARPFPKNFQVDVIYGNNAKTETKKLENDEGNLVFKVVQAVVDGRG